MELLNTLSSEIYELREKLTDYEYLKIQNLIYSCYKSIQCECLPELEMCYNKNFTYCINYNWLKENNPIFNYFETSSININNYIYDNLFFLENNSSIFIRIKIHIGMLNNIKSLTIRIISLISLMNNLLQYYNKYILDIEFIEIILKFVDYCIQHPHYKNVCDSLLLDLNLFYNHILKIMNIMNKLKLNKEFKQIIDNILLEKDTKIK
jgi:hypothetical protein